MVQGLTTGDKGLILLRPWCAAKKKKLNTNVPE